jgi:GTP-binding protein HflX
MNSRANGRSWRTGQGQPERAFLVGVEFSSRSAAGRDTQTRGSQARPGEPDAPLPPRQQPAGKVPPSARVARSVAASHLHAEGREHRGFSAEESMAELRELATSAGAVVIGEFQQRRPKPDPATLIGSGKLEELTGAVASSSPDLVIFDHDLTPSQQRNLERRLDLRVIDRTQLILDIFARHARNASSGITITCLY